LFIRKHEDQVDVRRGIEFAAAQFSHADDDQLLCLAGAVERLAVDGGQFAVMKVERAAQRDFGQFGQAESDFGEVGETVHIARHHTSEHIFPQAAKLPFEVFLAGDVIGQEIQHFLAGKRPVQAPVEPLGKFRSRNQASAQPSAVGGCADKHFGGGGHGSGLSAIRRQFCG
jgi:hypothetical protein